MQRRAYRGASSWLLATWRLWPDGRNSLEPGFAELRAFALAQLDTLRGPYDDLFVSLDLGARLGWLGQELQGRARIRQVTHMGRPPSYSTSDSYGIHTSTGLLWECYGIAMG